MKHKQAVPGGPPTKKGKKVDVFSRLEAANAAFLQSSALVAAAAEANRSTREVVIAPASASYAASPAIASLRVDQEELARRLEREQRFKEAAAAAQQARAEARKPHGKRTLVEVRSEQGRARGTSTSLEKDYLRLTSLPTLESVRPPEVLRKALEMVKLK